MEGGPNFEAFSEYLNFTKKVHWSSLVVFEAKRVSIILVRLKDALFLLTLLSFVYQSRIQIEKSIKWIGNL